MSTEDALGDRMKALEDNETSRKFLPGLSIYARIDGRGFSKFTKGMNRPYDNGMTQCMIETTKTLVEKTHATIGYCQSDEISLVWVPEDLKPVWFDGKIAKMTSVIAALTTSAFMNNLYNCFNEPQSSELRRKLPHFDARVICMPTLMEAANMMLWRNQDCTKNAISMAASAYYSHKELHGKNGSEKNEMLFQKGVNFNDFPYAFKRGTFCRREVVNRQFTPEEIAAIPEKHRPDPDKMIYRTSVNAFDLPPLTKISNKVDVLFNNATVIPVDGIPEPPTIIKSV